VRRGRLLEFDGASETTIVEAIDIPVALAGLARHNVANALAAAAGARAMGATIGQVADGLRDFRPSAELSPGRLNLYRLGSRVVIIDFAHNEAGTAAILDVAAGLAGGAAGRTTPITAIIGTAGDRPDDTLRGIGRIAALGAQRVVIKETPRYLRGREPEEVVAHLRAGIAEAGRDAAPIPVYPTEARALESELVGAGAAAAGGGRADAPRIVLLLCHEQRDEVAELLGRLGARPISSAADLLAVAPRLTDQHRPRGD
jgi:cyanophycin synthetase